MASLVLFCIGLFLVSLSVLTIVAWGVAARHPLGWRLYFVAAFVQLLANIGLLVVVLADYPSGAGMLFPGIAAGIAAAAAVLGLLLYTVLCLVLIRPPYWRRWLTGVGGFVAVAVLVVVIPRIVVKSGISTNVDLHGVVHDVDGQAVPGAVIHLGPCGYLQENPVVTDENGRFRVIANCRSYLAVNRIFNPQTGTECASRFRSSDHESLLVFDSLDGEPYSQGRPHWRGYPADRPFSVTCAWSMPQSIERHRATFDEFPADNLSVTIAADSDRRFLAFESGENDGLLHVRLRTAVEDDPAPARFELEIRPVNGGIQPTDDREPFNIAPLDNYRPAVTLDLGARNDDADRTYSKADRTYYFHSQDRAVYGAIRISSVFGFNMRTRTFDPNPSITFDVVANYGGSHVLLSHAARQGH